VKKIAQRIYVGLSNHVALPINISSVSKQFFSTKKKLTESWYSQMQTNESFYEATAALDIKSPD